MLFWDFNFPWCLIWTWYTTPWCWIKKDMICTILYYPGGGGVLKYCLWVFILPHIFLVENEHIIPLHVIHLFLHVQPGDNQKWCVPKTHECPRLSSNTIGKIKNSGQHSYIQMGPLLALLYKMQGYAVSNQATAF